VEKVTVINIQNAIDQIRQRSEVIANLEREGKVKIVAAMYDVATGQVRWL
jgi:carbonic anhydrase